MATDHIGHAPLPGGPQLRDGLGLGRARRQTLADESREDQVGGVTQDLGADERSGPR